MLAILIVFFLILAICGYNFWKAIRVERPKEKYLQPPETKQLIKVLVDEIHTALSLNETQLIHKYNATEPRIDGEVAAVVTYTVAMTTPCMIMFNHEENGDVKVTLNKMFTGN